MLVHATSTSRKSVQRKHRAVEAMHECKQIQLSQTWTMHFLEVEQDLRMETSGIQQHRRFASKYASPLTILY